MSNARYFAQGTDFYRVLYDNGSVDGPYIKPGSARSVGNQTIRPRVRYRWTENNERYAEEYFIRKSYKLQKLSAGFSGECGCDPYYPHAEDPECFKLEWTDVQE